MKKVILILGLFILFGTSQAQTKVGESTTDVYMLSNGELAYKTVKNDTVFVSYTYQGLTISKSYEKAKPDSVRVYSQLVYDKQELVDLKLRIEELRKDSITMSEVMKLFK